MDQVGILSANRHAQGPSKRSAPSHSPGEWAARLLLAGIFLLAAGAKVSSPLVPALAIERAAIPFISESPIASVGLVAGAEVWMAGALLMPRVGRVAPLLGILVVALFTAFLLVLRSRAGSQSCGCMGSLFGGTDPSREIAAGLVRNVGMLCVLAWLAFRREPFAASGASGIGTRRVATSRPAFTIVEVMVSISVVAILVAILLPTLSRTRAQAHITRALSGLRQVHAATALYAGDHGDALPYIATPQRPWDTIYVRGIPIEGLAYFRQGGFVLSVVAPEYHDNPADLRFTDPRQEFPVGIIASRYVMTCTAFAAPAYWRGANPPDDLRLYTGSRSADIAFPSSKGLWLDYEMSLLPTLAIRRGEYGPWVIARADGSAGTERFDPSYEQPFIRSYGAAPIPGMMTTVDGLAGRDF